MVTVRSAAVVAGVTAYGGLQWLGRTHGSTAEERRSPMPGDDLVQCPQTVATHAATIAAPPDQVWPWLAQVGWHRAGWYTPRWVDVLLFPSNAPSADRIMTDLPSLEVGDFIPDGAPETECGFVVREVVPQRVLVLLSTSHLPLSWRRRGRAGVAWSWTFALTPVDTPAGPGTRLVFRWRARTWPWWLTAAANGLVVPADFVMSSGMLRGLRSRAVRGPQPRTRAFGPTTRVR